MTLKVPVFKIHLNVANQNESHYADYNLTIAHDPDLGAENLIMKICLFSYLSHLEIEFAKEAFMEERPLIWKTNYESQIDICADYGILSSKKLKHMGHQCKESHLFLLDTQEEMAWLKQEEQAIKKFKNLSVYKIEMNPEFDFSSVITRSLSPSVTIDGEDLWISIQDATFLLKIIKQG